MNEDENRVWTETEFVFSNEQHEYGAVQRLISIRASVSFIHSYAFRNSIILHIENSLVDALISECPYGRILGFLNRSHYIFLQVAPQFC
jgi:hypothetical protein